MKYLFLLLLLCSLGLFFLQADSGTNKNNSLSIHEWGTFTTVHSSEGEQLNGIERDEEQLPPFVHQHKFEADKENFFKKHKMLLAKGFSGNIRNVNVKMETPVIYFYPEKPLSSPMDFDLKVHYRGGSISQWYPQRSEGEVIGTLQSTIDFANPSTMGYIRWQGKVLPKSYGESYTPKQSLVTEHWAAPRDTASNPIQVGDEKEKFLFYRGLGRFHNPLQVSNKNNKLKIKYLGDHTQKLGGEDLAYVMVYEKKKGQSGVALWSGRVNKKKEQIVDLKSNQKVSLKDEKINFVKALTEAGLFEDEAKAMLKTWESSYFESEGIRVFWIVPRSIVDRILPLNMEPKPKNIERVFVGRSEVLTEEFEKNLVQTVYVKPAMTGHRYYKAYYNLYQKRLREKVAKAK